MGNRIPVVEEEACRVKLAVPSTDCVEEFVAVTVRACCEETLLGAVYKPLEVMLPFAGLTAQVTLTPEGKLLTENCCVPEGATVAVPGLTLGVAEACRVKLAVPSTDCVEEFVAVMVRVCCEETLLGAVYKPPDVMLPVPELIAQATLAPEGKLLTENCWVPEGATVAVAGLTLGDAGAVGEASRVKLALPRTDCVDELFAMTVTVSCAETLLGAVYKPPGVILPAAGVTAQATLVPAGKFSTVNCLVFEGATVAAAGLTLGGAATVGEACRVKLAVPSRDRVEAFVAVTVRVC
jgi:hypothetical protein